MEYEIYKTDNELYHWGVLGMKWGVRRYQRKDGSLTPAGERRLKKERAELKKEEQVLKNRKATKAKIDRIAAKRKSLEEQKKELDGDDAKTKKGKSDEAKATKKSVKDMTDEELMSGIRRAQLEQQYSALTAQPETTAKGNGFVKEFWNKAAVPAIQEAGKGLIKDSLTKMGKKYLGLNTENTEDYVTKLGKEVKKMTLEKQYKKLKDEFESEKAKATEKEAEKSAKKEKTDSDTKTSETPKSDTDRKTSQAVNDFINRASSTGTNRNRSSATVDQNDYDFSTPVSGLPAVVQSHGKSTISGLLSGSTGRRNPNEVGYIDRDGNFHAY